MAGGDEVKGTLRRAKKRRRRRQNKRREKRRCWNKGQGVEGREEPEEV